MKKFFSGFIRLIIAILLLILYFPCEWIGFLCGLIVHSFMTGYRNREKLAEWLEIKE